MDSGMRAFNPWSWGLYYSISVSLSMISVFASFMASVVGWSVPNKVTRNTLSHVWAPPRDGQGGRQEDTVWRRHHGCVF